MRIVFMGTPDFAVSSLEALQHSSHEVVCVFTQPDKPKGRGHQVQPSPVKCFSEQMGIPVIQPITLKDPKVMELLQQYQPALIVVVAYGKILPPEILDLPLYGCINIHASLLPKYRGAAPIQWSLLNGDTKTGITTMYMEKGLDTGDILLQEMIDIEKNETALELRHRLSLLGARTLMQTLTQLENNTLFRRKQDDAQSCYAPMLTKQLSVLDFTQTALQIHNKIRGLSEWPSATTTINGKRLKIHRAEVVDHVHEVEPATLYCDKTFVIGCGEHTAIRFLQVQNEGGRCMSGEAFLRGNRLKKGTIFGG